MQDSPISDLDFRSPLDVREEALEVEFKLELDLSTPEGKAKLAKEICALCNFGGGWVVLGRANTGDYPIGLPDVLKKVDQDTINQIASAYLVPAPHCTLRWMQPDGIVFSVPVIRVPSVGVVPVCGKKNGPQDEKNKTIGVQKGVHYIRSAGPISAPIDSPEQWSDLIRRCVLSDKTALLGALSVMVSQPVSRIDQQPSKLDQDLEYLEKLWRGKVLDAKYQVDLNKNFIVLGFELISSGEKVALSIGQIETALSSRPIRNFGPLRFFEEGIPGDGRPYVVENAGVDGIQAESILHDGHVDVLPTLWRINEAGCGVQVAAYWEDTEHLKLAVEGRSSRKWASGENIWVAIQIEYIEGFLLNVHYLADRFGGIGQVRVRVCYHGLEGRALNSPQSLSFYGMRYRSRQAQRNVDLTFELAALDDEVRSSAVASIVQSLNKLFQGPEITADGVVRILEQHRTRG